MKKLRLKNDAVEQFLAAVQAAARPPPQPEPEPEQEQQPEQQPEAGSGQQLAVVRDFLFCFRTFSLCLNIWNLSLCSVGAGTGTAGSVGGDGAGRKRVFLRHLMLKMISLPRQARDKHRECTQKER